MVIIFQEKTLDYDAVKAHSPFYNVWGVNFPLTKFQ